MGAVKRVKPLLTSGMVMIETVSSIERSVDGR